MAGPDQLPKIRESGAHISVCGRFRYSLWRQWDKATRRPLGFVMLNPSTADADVDDPTIRRCMGFAYRNGYGGIRVTNLFSLRATNPAELLDFRVGIDNIGRQGNDPFDNLVYSCDDIVAAWGSIDRRLRWRAAEVIGMRPWDLFCLGTTKDGSPRHPLYVRGDQPLIKYEEPSDV